MTDEATTFKMQLRVILFEEEGNWVAQCLDVDIAAQAETLTDLPHEFERIVLSRLAVDAALKRKPFEGLSPAPPKFFEMYERAKYELQGEPPPFGGVPAAVMVPRARMKIGELSA